MDLKDFCFGFVDPQACPERVSVQQRCLFLHLALAVQEHDNIVGIVKVKVF